MVTNYNGKQFSKYTKRDDNQKESHKHIYTSIIQGKKILKIHPKTWSILVQNTTKDQGLDIYKYIDCFEIQKTSQNMQHEMSQL